MTRLLAGRLLLLDVVGAGSAGPVRRAWDLRSRREVVVKPAGVSAPPHVDHPHVLRHEIIGGLVVSPLARGGSLEGFLASYGVLPDDRVTLLLDQLLGALAAVHAAGWVHRDVKPANLLLDGTRTDHLWLADLGAARRVGELGPAEGSPGYVAPEARVPVRAAPAQDLYAAGVTASELLTGRPPRTPHDLGRSSLRPLLRSLLDPDPARRPASADEARARLPPTRHSQEARRRGTVSRACG